MFLCVDGNQTEQDHKQDEHQAKQQHQEEQHQEQRLGSQQIQRLLQERPASFNYLHSLVLNTW